MKQVTRWQTADGREHETEGAARKHADARYTNELCQLAAESAQITTYSGMKAWLHTHQARIAALIPLRADAELEGDDE